MATNNWSTNEIEKRYEPELLEKAKYLLDIDDPDLEGKLFSNFMRLSPFRLISGYGTCCTRTTRN